MSDRFEPLRASNGSPRGVTKHEGIPGKLAMSRGDTIAVALKYYELLDKQDLDGLLNDLYSDDLECFYPGFSNPITRDDFASGANLKMLEAFSEPIFLPSWM